MILFLAYCWQSQFSAHEYSKNNGPTGKFLPYRCYIIIARLLWKKNPGFTIDYSNFSNNSITCAAIKNSNKYYLFILTSLDNFLLLGHSKLSICVSRSTRTCYLWVILKTCHLSKIRFLINFLRVIEIEHTFRILRLRIYIT